jgi:NADH-quinone oxidoreductase subunit N
VMYFDKAQDASPLEVNFDMRVALSINGLAILFLGLMPNTLMLACFDAIKRSLQT